VPPIEDVEAGPIAAEPVEITPRELRTGGQVAHRRLDEPGRDEFAEPTIEARVERAPRDLRSTRIEPTFTAEESVTAELPVEDVEPVVAPARSSPAQPQADAPTLSMSSTPAPRRIERRKIIALRLAAGPQRLNGLQLKSALESEGLQHGKYDVFHRIDGDGAAIFSVASMVEPGTFDPEKMAQENFPGITLFTQLPAPVAGMLAFNELIACSRRLHAALGGTLQDERGVPLTVHRIERIRQEIREFEHRSAGDTERPSSSFSPAP
jgi:cell division protein ZipA